MRFEFATSSRIIFGPGTISQVGIIASGFGKRAFVVMGQGGADPSRVIQLLENDQVQTVQFAVGGEPDIEQVKEGLNLAKEAGCDLVVGYGGGSVIDTGKAIAGMLTNPGDLMDYLEVIGKGAAIQNPALPYIAVPTTAGTGSEVTKNAVLAAHEHKVKVSLRSQHLLPRVALIDPELTLSLPPEVTASTGMDALAQVIEPYVSIKANPMTDGFCRQGIQNAAWALRAAYQNGQDAEAREAMSLTSLMGGLSLANAGLGAAHGFAAPIGGAFPAPHGAILAILLAPVMSMNVKALRQRAADSPALLRYTEVSRWLTGSVEARPEDGAAWLRELCDDLQIPRLHTYGIEPADLAVLVEKASVASSMQANPIKLTREEMLEILSDAL